MNATIIICTYNRARYLTPLLESLARNDFDKARFEILLVDNNSTDETPSVFQRFAQSHPEISCRYVQEPEQGLSAARNKGIREAQGDVIIYVDDDALVDEHYISYYMEYLESHPEVMAAGGPIEPQYETHEPDWMTDYTRALLCGRLNYGNCVREFPAGRYPGGGNAAYRREVFQKVGLFNTALGRKGTSLMASEEKDIFDKMASLEMPVRYLPGPVLHHIIPQYKLEREYFDRLTRQIGISEHRRTLAISKGKFMRRLFDECIKWGGTLVLQVGYLFRCQPMKGWKLILFRRNVTRGLISGK